MSAAIARDLTGRARAACPEIDIEVFWDQLWAWRIGDARIPDPELLSRSEPDFAKRARSIEKYLRDADDYWFHVYKPQAGDVIVDIGAGRGEDVYAFSKAVGSTGMVWAIEPHPVSFLGLKKLCEWNGLSNVRILNYACTERTERLWIETMEVWESNYVRDGEASEKSFSVDGISFDELSRREGIAAISFLKMNIEGAERYALIGCRDALQRTAKLCVAAHDFRADRGEGESFRTFGFVREFLTENGFRLTTRDADPRYYVPFHVHGER